MGKPAARVGDMHVCPMVNPGPVPHVGGPILPPGAPTVLIGGMPAARAGDMAMCTGPPDAIAMGSTGVFIGGMPAARMGDTTAHGGTVVAGLPTVLIGEIGSAVVSPTVGRAMVGTGATRGALAGAAAGQIAQPASATGAGAGASAGEPQHWVEIELVDEDDRPVAGARYRVEMPDGTVVEGRLDGRGHARIQTRQPGQCQITFTDDDEETWEPVS